jgi:putative transposase
MLLYTRLEAGRCFYRSDSSKFHHSSGNSECHLAGDLTPCLRTKLSMICAKVRGRRHVEEQAHGGADDWGVANSLRRGVKQKMWREVGVSKHTLYAWKAKYSGMDVRQAQEARQLRDENTKLRKLVADLSLDKEALQSVIRKNGWNS